MKNYRQWHLFRGLVGVWCEQGFCQSRALPKRSEVARGEDGLVVTRHDVLKMFVCNKVGCSIAHCNLCSQHVALHTVDTFLLATNRHGNNC